MSDLERLADLDRDLQAALPPDLLGSFALFCEEESSLTPHEQRCMELTDVQTRQAAELQSEGTLWRAYLEATNYDIAQPSKPLLPSDLPYRACVYRLRGTQAGTPTTVSGVRFITAELDDDGNVNETNYDVPVSVNGRPRTGFGSLDIDLMERLVTELENLRHDLRLRHDLASVLPTRRP